ncbi:MAG TPA: 50S ribosomal protein L4 [Chloroflexota bacterium]|nr:50S ribosomal protein L4 [Chloroflexota bacterium]
MAEIAVRDLAGNEVETLSLSDEVFGAPVNAPLMHQAVVRILAARRAGTQKAKTRGEVSGGGEKPYRQKGTGRARQGSRTSPLWRGGGVVFPPTPRSYQVRMPRKMRRAATRSALTSRIADDGIIVVSQLTPDEPRTRVMVTALQALNATGKILLVDERISDLTDRAARNIPGVEMRPASTLNIVDVLQHDKLVFSVDGIRQLERLLSDGNA